MRVLYETNLSLPHYRPVKLLDNGPTVMLMVGEDLATLTASEVEDIIGFIEEFIEYNNDEGCTKIQNNIYNYAEVMIDADDEENWMSLQVARYDTWINLVQATDFQKALIGWIDNND